MFDPAALGQRRKRVLDRVLDQRDEHERRQAGITQRRRHVDDVVKPVADQSAALAQFQGQSPRLRGVLDLPRRLHADAVRRVHRQRQAVLHPARRQELLSGVRGLFAKNQRQEFKKAANYRDPYLLKLIAEKGGTMVEAKDPLLLRHAQSQPADAGAFETDLGADRGAMPPGGREARRQDLRRSRNRLAASASTSRFGTPSKPPTSWVRGPSAEMDPRRVQAAQGAATPPTPRRA